MIVYQSLWDSSKAVPREKFIALKKKEESNNLSYLSAHLQELEKEKQINSKVSKKKKGYKKK